MKTRRLRCCNRHCPRKIFAERLPGVAAPQARETNRLPQTLRQVGYVQGGLPGSSLLQQMGMMASRDTILRRMKTTSGRPQAGKVRVLGVDDWAWRKQQRYGTMLMDLERRRVVDLLPVRSAGQAAGGFEAIPISFVVGIAEIGIGSARVEDEREVDHFAGIASIAKVC